MDVEQANVLICGAGIAGIALAYDLAVKKQMSDVVLVDPLPPLTMTSDKSTECYRNWWVGPGDDMVRLMNRSIDLLDDLHNESPHELHMHRRGYIYVTGDETSLDDFIANAEEICALGAGDLRIHRGEVNDPEYIPYTEHGIFDAPDGADILLDKDLIQRHFPYVTDDAVAVLHARRCGWLAARQFGMYMLEQAKAAGVQLIEGRVEDVIVSDNRVQAVKVSTLDGTQTISADKFVSAAGPLQAAVGDMLGIDIPVYNELHLKVAFNDSHGVIPRDMPLLIWDDPQYIAWSDEEKAFLAESDETRWLLEEFPSSVHGRAEGTGDSESILFLWEYADHRVEPVFPIPIDEQFAEIALRGMTRVIPGLAVYLEQMPKPFVDGGYYTRTKENRPLISPLSVEDTYVLGAFSGFGLMGACGAADLLAAYITGSDLPDYAPAFSINRYQDPAYQDLLATWGDSGQL